MYDRQPRTDLERQSRGNKLALYAAIDSLPSWDISSPYGTDHAILTERGVSTISKVLESLKLMEGGTALKTVRANRCRPMPEYGFADKAELWMEFDYPELSDLSKRSKVRIQDRAMVRLDLGQSRSGGDSVLVGGSAGVEEMRWQVDEEILKRVDRGLERVVTPFKVLGREKRFLAVFASTTHQILIGNARRGYAASSQTAAIER